MTTKSSTNNLSARPLLVISQVVLLLLLAATPARAHWPNQNLTKWLQPPDPTNGIDVLVGQLTTSCQPIILADDFQCRRPGPISDIHIWTSWTNNQPSWNLPITLCIWSDVKAVTNAVGKFPSHPGTILWCQTFLPGQYTIQPWRTAFELFWNPNPQCPFFGSDKMIWLYNFYPTNAFIQQGSPTVACTYWLSMSVPQFGNGNRAPFGWKTASTHWNDDAVWAVTDITGTNIFPAGTNGWMELYDPRNTVNPRSLDLAFVLTMPQTTNAAGFGNATATNKWAEYPDPNGLDVNATVQDIVADDFQCNSAGLITNVQVWASWKSNRFDNAASFIVSIYDDVPAGSVFPSQQLQIPAHRHRS